MALRTTAAELIARIRDLIGDTGATPVFTDLQIQATLDQHRSDVVQMALEPITTLDPITGDYVYLEYVAPCGGWETGAIIYGCDYADISALATASDPLIGHWGFTLSQFPPCFITGRYFDLYATAADMLFEWAAKVKLDFDVSTDGQSFSRNQKSGNLRELARIYQSRASATIGKVSRSDC